MNLLKKVIFILFVSIMFFNCGNETTEKKAEEIVVPKDPFVNDFPKSTFVDPRDNTEYPTVKIEYLEWMAKNLNYDNKNGYCYNDDEANCATNGKMYTWFDAQKVCPEGWHLPTKKDWGSIYKRFGRSGSSSYQALKIGGDTGFEATLSGWRSAEGEYHSMDKKGCYWTANDLDSDNGRYYVMSKKQEKLVVNNTLKSYSMACRCVRKAEKK